MSKEKDTIDAPQMSAAKLRERMAEHEMKEAEKAIEKQRAMEEEEEKFREFFMTAKITDEERLRFRQTVARLAEQGQTEICAVSFPSDFCSDGGRRINNNLPDWEKTLTGRAAQAYQLWEKNAKPLGYKLEARVLNYPKGMVGDIGLFVKW